MKTSDIILSFFELAAFVGVIWAIFNEYKLIDFEDKIKEKIKKIWR